MKCAQSLAQGCCIPGWLWSKHVISCVGRELVLDVPADPSIAHTNAHACTAASYLLPVVAAAAVEHPAAAIASGVRLRTRLGRESAHGELVNAPLVDNCE
eukprot:5516077-Prymnesium_polylepis.1